MTSSTKPDLEAALLSRFGEAVEVSDLPQDCRPVSSMITRGSCRIFEDRSVPEGLLKLLCATALASPTKSDLQQRDIVVLSSPEKRARLAELVSGQAWVSDAPELLVFCGNNRRQRLLHDWHGVPFANDHVDAVINATADAAIALGAFVSAAEAVGLGCCPISAVRNEASAVSELLGLPEHVFPFAGLAVGYPSHPAHVSMRLPFSVTCHTDTYREDDLRDAVTRYDDRRAKAQPYASQRFVDEFGQSDNYAWSDDKVRQYSREERADFGAFLRARGFCLE